MKQILLVIIAIILTVTTYACECRIMNFSEEVSYADQIFIGKVIKKATSDMAYYLFSVSKTFKGGQLDTITIKTGFGGPDCGMEFETGKEYLVYSHNDQTSRCRRNALASNNRDIDKLKSLFNRKFTSAIGETTKPDFQAAVRIPVPSQAHIHYAWEPLSALLPMAIQSKPSLV